MTLNTDFPSTDSQLLYQTVEPILLRTRGKHPDEKARVLRELNPAQRSAFLMQVLVGHMQHGTAQFFTQIAYLTERMDFWRALQSAVNFFQDQELLPIVKEMQFLFEAKDRAEHIAQFAPLDLRYQSALPQTLARVAGYIRSHPNEF